MFTTVHKFNMIQASIFLRMIYTQKTVYGQPVLANSPNLKKLENFAEAKFYTAQCSCVLIDGS